MPGKATITFTPRENYNQDFHRIEARVTDSSRREIIASILSASPASATTSILAWSGTSTAQDKVTVDIKARMNEQTLK